MIATIGIILVWILIAVGIAFGAVCAFVGFMILWEMLKCQ